MITAYKDLREFLRRIGRKRPIGQNQGDGKSRAGYCCGRKRSSQSKKRARSMV